MDSGMQIPSPLERNKISVVQIGEPISGTDLIGIMDQLLVYHVDLY